MKPIYKNTRATWLPALDQTYVGALSHDELRDVRAEGQLPLNITLRDLNQRNERALYYNPCSLITAAYAELDLQKSKIKERWLHEGVETDYMLADSGGFSPEAMGINWGLPDEYEKQIKKIIDWQLEVADDIIVVDVPPRLPETPEFNECFQQSKIAGDIYEEYALRRGARVLACIHGEDLRQARRWSKAFRNRGFDFAFAGMGPKIILPLVCEMLEAGDLKNCHRLHMLGVGAAHLAIFYSFLQQELRRHPDAYNHIAITYDTSSATQDALATSKMAVGICVSAGKELFTVETVGLNDLYGSLMRKAEERTPADQRRRRDVEKYNLPFIGSGPILGGGRFRIGEILVNMPMGGIGPDSLSNAIIVYDYNYWHSEKIRMANELADYDRLLRADGQAGDHRLDAYFEIEALIKQVLESPNPTRTIGNRANQRLLAGYF